ncbi:hypothetical protein M409DRAFT_71543 [Zasmidium cellare ATCC 36951]|uniref:SRP9 domain-containing protein n=1 Tax=Zasmidium cellare ATCC 36951 TaxID=1080233 RepID=A0A6A6BX85_ZASCE|nr:uncharacterized protein M409DRAFT_71543 [Zasmidium cellare ATCC 36951]KAF2158648.1 hypothetical protein M409DRAFT_71543 [Zasmidium cellare ATCC 36951]
MVLLATSQEWQTQTSRLLQARPTTTRITTKYNIPNLESERYQKKMSKKRKRDAGGEEKDKEDAAAPKIPQATLELKTYDPESGVVLKFKTNRAAEVGRLVMSLGTLGRYMAALPVKEEDVAMDDATATEQAADDTKDAAPAAAAPSANDAKPQQGAGGGGGNKKKKKNKK